MLNYLMCRNKLKIKGSIKKRFRMTANGTLKCGFANRRHHSRQKNSRMLRQKVGMRALSYVENIMVTKMIGGQKI